MILRKKKGVSYNTYVRRIISLIFKHFEVMIEPLINEYRLMDLENLKKNGDLIEHEGAFYSKDH